MVAVYASYIVYLLLLLTDKNAFSYKTVCCTSQLYWWESVDDHMDGLKTQYVKCIELTVYDFILYDKWPEQHEWRCI